MTTTRKDTAEERKLYGEVGVVLFRMDKADPEISDERVWKDVKPDYTRRARRLWKALQRHGYAIVPAPVGADADADAGAEADAAVE